MKQWIPSIVHITTGTPGASLLNYRGGVLRPRGESCTLLNIAVCDAGLIGKSSNPLDFGLFSQDAEDSAKSQYANPHTQSSAHVLERDREPGHPYGMGVAYPGRIQALQTTEAVSLMSGLPGDLDPTIPQIKLEPDKGPFQEDLGFI